jgi:hypothetical protein
MNGCNNKSRRTLPIMIISNLYVIEVRNATGVASHDVNLWISIEMKTLQSLLRCGAIVYVATLESGFLVSFN